MPPDAERCSERFKQSRRPYQARRPSRPTWLSGLAGVLHDLGADAGAQERFEQRGKPYQARRQPRPTR